jgi:UDP-N-acetylglucosamine diphosphorylase/glucosamine-1-phosphate N-acetyltransferase
MPSRPVYLFDDGERGIRPLTGLRASFEVRIGPFTLIERLLDEALAPAGFFLWGAFVPGPMAALVRERHGIAVNALRSGGVREPVLLLNGRCAAPDWGRLASLTPGSALVEPESGGLVAACVEEAMATRVLAEGAAALRVEPTAGASLMTRPWHARRFRDGALREGLDAAARTGRFQSVASTQGRTALGAAMAHPGARIHPGVIIDAESGPVVIDDGAVLRPGAVLVGPCYVGPHSTVLERATIRPHTVIGPWCKVNGEVSGTVFQGFANKAHDGFLGDSWVGEWVNLGAGTTNSNLLNTYGEVIARATPGGANERTGEQFLGAVIGDHVKAAICTRINTGAVIHTGAMVATTAPALGCVSPFSWCVDEGMRRYRLDKFVEVARAAMARRGIAPSAEYLAAIARLHAEGPSPTGAGGAPAAG